MTPLATARPLRCANLQILPSERRVLINRRPLDLTTREFEVLWALAERRNRVVPRPVLYELVWRRPMSHRDRSTDAFVLKLRRKLQAVSPSWIYIHTHPGGGYRFAPKRAE